MLVIAITILASVGLSLLMSYWIHDLERRRTDARLRALENRIDLPIVVEDMKYGEDWAWPGKPR